MNDYIQDTYNIINTSLDGHLYLKQIKVTDEIKKILDTNKNIEEQKIINEISNHTDQNDLRETFKNKKALLHEDSMLKKFEIFEIFFKIKFF